MGTDRQWSVTSGRLEEYYAPAPLSADADELPLTFVYTFIARRRPWQWCAIADDENSDYSSLAACVNEQEWFRYSERRDPKVMVGSPGRTLGDHGLRALLQ